MISYIFLCITIFFLALFVYIFFVWSIEQRVLKRIAMDLFDSSRTIGENISKFNSWVYGNKGFAKNNNYFLIKKLGPTPSDILEHGGDCADKSRLLSAMLKQVSIKSTLAMLYPCEECGPSHTVLEAEYEHGWMVVDPVYNIDFPDGSGGYYGLRDLSDDRLMIDRIEQLTQERGESDKIAYYLKSIEGRTYKFAKTLNWNKNKYLHFAGRFLAMFVKDPYLIRRPIFTEDPKRFLAIVSFLMFLMIFMLYWISI
jgi:hypothetical protein